MPSSIPSFLDYSQAVRVEIDRALGEYVDFDAGCPRRLNDAIRHSLLAPGKRLRPLLTLMSAECCGSDRAAAMPAACAVEMVHAYSLIHDDLPAMDDDDLRRGRPTCHRAFDEATAILAGDALLARAFEVLAVHIQPAETAGRCCREMGRAAGATQLVGGQADDLAAEFSSADRDVLESIHHRKTGAMFRVSTRLGGIVAGANDEQLTALEAYAKNLGLAFQVVDDLLDLRGTESDMGKRTQKDSERGKLTYPSVIGVDASRQFARDLIDRACASVEPFGEDAQGLEALARFVVERNQ